MSADQAEHLSVSVEAQAAHIGTVRLFVGSVARHFGCEEETVEDIKLAVSEACADAVEHGPSEGPLVVEASWDGSVLRFDVPAGERPGDPAGAPGSVASHVSADPEEFVSAQRRAVIRALFPRAEFGSSSDGSRERIRFAVEVQRLPDPAGRS